MKKKKIVIIGGGITGLTTAWKSATNFLPLVLEKSNKLGGIASTFQYKDCKLDYGPHKIYTQMPWVIDEIKSLLGRNLLVVQKKSRVRLGREYLNYPLTLKDTITKMSPIITLKCGLSFIKIKIAKMLIKKHDNNYESYLINRFGYSLYSLVFEHYANKIWGNPKELSAKLAKIRVSMPSLIILLKTILLGNKNTPEINADKFYYPKNGLISLSNAMAKQIKQKKGRILLNAKVIRINVKRKKVESVVYQKKTVKTIKPQIMISTMPLNDLVFTIKPKLPQHIIDVAKALKYKSLILIYIVVNKDKVMDDTWLFFPEKEFIFNRISEQKNFSRHMVPKGKTVITAEVTCDKGDSIWVLSSKELFDKVMSNLKHADIITESLVEDYFAIKLENVYPVYNVGYQKNTGIILDYLDSIENLYTHGRFGFFNYYNIDHCMDSGIKLAEHINKNGSIISWKGIRKSLEDYKIVD